MNANSNRRPFLRRCAAFTLVALAPLARAQATVPGPCRLSLVHAHTGERLEVTYAEGRDYNPEALGQLNRLLRDHYTGQVGLMDPRLFDQLHQMQALLGCGGAFKVISGFRCADTNERLRAHGSGGVARRSLHMEGRAIDVRLPGVPLAELRDAALALRAGGVGFYPHEQFVHVDTGRVRHW